MRKSEEQMTYAYIMSDRLGIICTNKTRFA
jgi:hypothetical protein